jgi:hypothetical protein
VNRRKALLHLLFVFNLATIAALAFQVDIGGSAASSVDACSDFPECAALTARADATLDERLAAKHAPIVYLPQLDQPCQAGGSSFAPIPVDVVLHNPEVKLRSVTGDFILEGPGPGDLFRLARKSYFGSYLDFPGNPMRPGCRFESDGLRFSAGYENLAYARIVRDEDVEGIILQYWLFYYFNDWNNNHEGDWELVQLYFETPDVRQALEDGPSLIGLSQHRSGEVGAWDGGKVSREGERPVVYVARGSHANYFSPGLYLGRGEEGRGLGCDDASASTRRVALGVQLLPAQVQGSRDPFAWIEFKGYWGEVEEGATHGSTAPATKQNWHHPRTWQGDLKDRSVELPTRGFIGLDPGRTFCDVVTFASEFLLPFYRETPLLSVFAAGAISMGLIGSLATTRFLPVRRRELRSRRRLGQVLTAALHIYLSRAYVFLTIALTAFPLGVAMTVLGNVSPQIEGLTDLAPLSRAAFGQAALALALGSLHIIFIAAVVVLSVTAVLARVPEAQGRAFRLRRLPQLLLPRCLALFAVAGLCLTVVGIPLAIRQSLRWAFLEQAMLVDGKSPRQSFGASSAVVSGHWLWVGFALCLLSGIAFLLAPAVGIALIMTLKALPPAYISLATAGIYAMVMPYVAIALTLIYFELQLRAGDEEKR